MEFKNFSEFKQMEGKELSPSQWLTVTQDMVNAFADATLDFQWIHIDVEKAKKFSPFKAPVAHGFMSVSLLSKFVEDVVNIKSTKMGVNYGLNKVRFPHHVAVGSRLRLKSSVAKIEDYAPNAVKVFWDCLVEIEGVEKPACVGQFITLMFE